MHVDINNFNIIIVYPFLYLTPYLALQRISNEFHFASIFSYLKKM